jgi:hypothetical protein
MDWEEPNLAGDVGGGEWELGSDLSHVFAGVPEQPDVHDPLRAV